MTSTRNPWLSTSLVSMDGSLGSNRSSRGFEWNEENESVVENQLHAGRQLPHKVDALRMLDDEQAVNFVLERAETGLSALEARLRVVVREREQQQRTAILNSWADKKSSLMSTLEHQFRQELNELVVQARRAARPEARGKRYKGASGMRPAVMTAEEAGVSLAQGDSNASIPTIAPLHSSDSISAQMAAFKSNLVAKQQRQVNALLARQTAEVESNTRRLEEQFSARRDKLVSVYQDGSEGKRSVMASRKAAESTARRAMQAAWDSKQYETGFTSKVLIRKRKGRGSYGKEVEEYLDHAEESRRVVLAVGDEFEANAKERNQAMKTEAEVELEQEWQSSKQKLQDRLWDRHDAQISKMRERHVRELKSLLSAEETRLKRETRGPYKQYLDPSALNQKNTRSANDPSHCVPSNQPDAIEELNNAVSDLCTKWKNIAKREIHVLEERLLQAAVLVQPHAQAETKKLATKLDTQEAKSGHIVQLQLHFDDVFKQHQIGTTSQTRNVLKPKPLKKANVASAKTADKAASGNDGVIGVGHILFNPGEHDSKPTCKQGTINLLSKAEENGKEWKRCNCKENLTLCQSGETSGSRDEPQPAQNVNLETLLDGCPPEGPDPEWIDAERGAQNIEELHELIVEGRERDAERAAWLASMYYNVDHAG